MEMDSAVGQGDVTTMPRAITRREFDTEEDNPRQQVIQTVADLKDVEQNELQPFYNEVDHIVDNLYQNPPAAQAQVIIEFSYEGYRIKLRQDGSATFIPVTETDRET